MDDVVKFVFTDQVAVAARCLDAGLHNGRLGLLHGVLDEIWDGHKPSHYKVVGLEVNNVLVGCAVHHRRTHQIMVYVHHAHRRCGHGTALIRGLELMTGVPRERYHAMHGDEGSEEFYDAVQVVVYPEIELSVEEATQVLSGDVAVRAMVNRKKREYRRGWLNRHCAPKVDKE